MFVCFVLLLAWRFEFCFGSGVLGLVFEIALVYVFCNCVYFDTLLVGFIVPSYHWVCLGCVLGSLGLVFVFGVVYSGLSCAFCGFDFICFVSWVSFSWFDSFDLRVFSGFCRYLLFEVGSLYIVVVVFGFVGLVLVFSLGLLFGCLFVVVRLVYVRLLLGFSLVGLLVVLFVFTYGWG